MDKTPGTNSSIYIDIICLFIHFCNFKFAFINWLIMCYHDRIETDTLYFDVSHYDFTNDLWILPHLRLSFAVWWDSQVTGKAMVTEILVSIL